MAEVYKTEKFKTEMNWYVTDKQMVEFILENRADHFDISVMCISSQIGTCAGTIDKKDEHVK